MKLWTDNPLGVYAAHHVADRPVLAGRVDRLEDDEDSPGVLGGQPGLVGAEQFHSLAEELSPFLLLA